MAPTAVPALGSRPRGLRKSLTVANIRSASLRRSSRWLNLKIRQRLDCFMGGQGAMADMMHARQWEEAAEFSR